MIHETYAIKGYFFGKNYSDLFNSISDSFDKTWEECVELLKDIKEAWRERNPFFALGQTIFHALLFLFRLTFGEFFTAFFSIFHILIITIVMVFVYLGFVTVAAIDKIYRIFKRLTNNCPNPDCQRKFGLPVYHCPNCGAPHQYLYPNKYGIFQHRCTCGHKLPTLLINGRHKLNASCPYCGHQAFKGIHSSTIFPVFGGRSSGKTCFINSALTEIESMAPSMNCEYQYFYEVAGDERMRFEQRMKDGVLPESTHDKLLLFYNFYLSPRKSVVKNFVSVCDVSGEVFQSRQDILRQTGYKYADAVIFVLDPLSILAFRDEMVEQGYDVASYAYSDHQIDDILGAMLTSLDELYRKKNWKLSLAVAITKSDMPGIDKYFGPEAIRAYKAKHKGKTSLQVRDALARQFLIDHAEGNAVNMIETRFEEVHYFFTSATGKNHVEGQALESYGNADPILYCVDKAYKNLNFDKELWRK